MGLKPSECLIVEDAINGVEAAKKAGCKMPCAYDELSKRETFQGRLDSLDLASADERGSKLELIGRGGIIPYSVSASEYQPR